MDDDDCETYRFWALTLVQRDKEATLRNMECSTWVPRQLVTSPCREARRAFADVEKYLEACSKTPCSCNYSVPSLHPFGHEE